MFIVIELKCASTFQSLNLPKNYKFEQYKTYLIFKYPTLNPSFVRYILLTFLPSQWEIITLDERLSSL